MNNESQFSDLSGEREPASGLEGLNLQELLESGLDQDALQRGGGAPLPEIEGYEMIRLIGYGGMGSVYLATQLSLGREVAVKVLTFGANQDALLLERLEREARVMAGVSHPHLVQVYDFIRLADGSAAIVMEYVKGGNVRTAFLANRSPRVPVDSVIRIAKEVLACLEAVHAAKVIHRDIKPENLLLDAAGSVKVSDFGLALAEGDEISRLTVSGTSAGTLGYMAPEQLEGQAVDARSDLYALGVVFYELLAGRKPVGNFPSIRELRDDVPKWLERVIFRALEQDPQNRMVSAGDFLEALEAPADAMGKQHRPWLIPVAVFAVLTVGVGIWWQTGDGGLSTGRSQGEVSATDPFGIVQGSWEKRESGYQSGTGVALLGISGTPLTGKKVVIRTSFVRLRGRHSVAVFFRHQNGWANVEVDAWNQHLAGVGVRDGLNLSQQVQPPVLELENGRIYELEVSISDTEIETRLDGEVIQRAEIAGESLGISDPWIWDEVDPGGNQLMLGSYQSPTWFRTVSITEE